MTTDTVVLISDKEFDLLRGLIYKRFGIKLTHEKKSLLVTRLQNLLKSGEFTSFEDYYERLVRDTSGRILSDLADRISTNHTFFNREKDHFEFFYKTALTEVTERLKKDNVRDLRVWCAASSTGEEPYMLAMLMREFFGMEYHLWSAGVLATDISQKVLDVAVRGVYAEERAAGLPNQFLRKYFRRRADGQYEITEALRSDVTFRRFNLMNEKFPFKKPFDIIFCRNVMIYFDEPTREALVEKLYNLTATGGYFFIGHSETLGRGSRFTYVKPAVYRKG